MVHVKQRVCLILCIVLAGCFCQGCLLTRVVTVPIRVGGAVLTIIPYAGDAAHESLDETASIIDDVPL